MALVGEKRGVGVVIYKDLRGFIKQVDELGALRHVNGADPRFELGGITEVAAGTGECPALLFDRLKGFRPGFRVFDPLARLGPFGISSLLGGGRRPLLLLGGVAFLGSRRNRCDRRHLRIRLLTLDLHRHGHC